MEEFKSYIHGCYKGSSRIDALTSKLSQGKLRGEEIKELLYLETSRVYEKLEKEKQRREEAEKALKEKEDQLKTIANKFDLFKFQREVKSSSVGERIYPFLEKQESGCIIFTGSKSPNGYGMISLNNRPVGAHRVIMALSSKSFYDFTVVDHVCMNRACCNPEHLRAVGYHLNSTENSSGIPSINKNKLYCVNGHELFGSNVRYRNNKGNNRSRVCRKCQSENKLKSKKYGEQD